MKQSSLVRSILLSGVALSCLVVSGCDRPADKLSYGLPMPKQTYEHISPVTIAAGQMNIVQGDGDSITQPDNFIVSLPAQAERYLRHKVVVDPAGGIDDVLNVLIEDAKIKHHFQKSETGLLKMMDVDGFDVFDIDLTLNFQRINE